MNQTFTKAMLPLALIVSAIFLNIHNIKNTFSPPPAVRENILNIEGGKVDLGNVTGERETLNIKVYVDKDNEVLFHILPSIVKDLNGATTLDKPIINITKEGANKRGNSSRLTQSFHFFMFEPIFSPVNALNQPI